VKQNAYFKKYNAKKRIAEGRPERVFHEGKGWKTYKTHAEKELNRKTTTEERKVLREKWKEEWQRRDDVPVPSCADTNLLSQWHSPRHGGQRAAQRPS
jgi:hypothetical protein